MPENRLAERADFLAQVDVIHGGAPMPRRVWGKDLSESGIFLQTTHPFRVGDKVALRFDVEDEEVRVAAAEVMWVRPFEPVSVDGQMPGVGLRFLSIEPDGRQVIRRFVRQDAGDDDVEGRQEGSWVSLPPFTDGPRVASLPPSGVTLPPATPSVLRELGASASMPPVSLPPFSLPPLAITMPPDEPLLLPVEDRVFSRLDDDVPAPPPLPAERPAAGGHPLSGWRFSVEQPGENDTLPERPAAPEELRVRFSDEAPARLPLGEQGAASQEPSWSFDEGARGGVLEDGAPPPEAQPLHALHAAFEEGAVALKDLPTVEERLPHPRARRLPAMPVAAALLGLGTAVGALYGLLDGGAPPGMASEVSFEEAAPAPSRAEAAPLPVAEAERDLPRPDLVALVDTPARQASLAKAPAPRAELKAPAPAPKQAGAQEPAPEAAEVPPASIPSQAAAKKSEAVVVHGVSVASGRIALPFPRGEVKRAFGLGGPGRVVVDLAGMQGAPPRGEEIGRAGVSRVRTGQPEPGTFRVVVELDSAEKPSSVHAELRGGDLVVTWR